MLNILYRTKYHVINGILLITILRETGIQYFISGFHSYCYRCNDGHAEILTTAQHESAGNSTKEKHPLYELHRSHFSSDRNGPVYSGFQFTFPAEPLWKGDVMGHFITINNPFHTFSVLEPGKSGGCQNVRRATVRKSAEQRKCLVAMNAGMFNITSDECLGCVVVDGKVVQNKKEVQNAHFGIKKDGSIFVGYIPEDTDMIDFQQLVGGVIWIVRDGKNFVAEAINTEREETQNTSTLQGFSDCLSGRAVIGHNAKGQVIMAEVDGKTWESGISLYNFADLLISFGVINAINLDGGGSVTLVIEDTVMNHPTDSDYDPETNTLKYKVREVGSIVCVHDYICDDEDCSNHGDCDEGQCQCHGNWTGPSCSYKHYNEVNSSANNICNRDCPYGALSKKCRYGVCLQQKTQNNSNHILYNILN